MGRARGYCQMHCCKFCIATAFVELPRGEFWVNFLFLATLFQYSSFVIEYSFITPQLSLEDYCTAF